MDEELGDDPTLLLGLTLFLVEGAAKEQDDAPSPSIPMLMDSPWPPSSENPQCHPAYTRGAQPKVPAKPSAG